MDADSCSWRGKRRWIVRRIRSCDAYRCRDSYRKVKNCCHTKVSLAFPYPGRILHRATTNRLHVFTYKGSHYLMFTNKRKRMIAVKNVTTKNQIDLVKSRSLEKAEGRVGFCQRSIARAPGAKETRWTKKRKLAEIDIVW